MMTCCNRVYRFVLFGILFAAAALHVIHQDPKLFLDGKRQCRLEQVPQEKLKNLESSICVAITGASSGIGKELARILIDINPKVKLILTGRTKARAEAALEGKSRGPLLALDLDLEDDSSVDQFVKVTRSTISSSCYGKLDYLFLNAGMIYAPGYAGSYVSRNGKYDKVFASNFVGHVRLLKGLLPEIKRANTRVAWVSSINHLSVGLPLDHAQQPLVSSGDALDELKAYATSKLAMTAMQQALVKDGSIVNSVVVRFFTLYPLHS